MDKYAKKQNQHGFTLIEILVSVAIFSVVMLVGVGALLTISEANRKAQALQVVTNNLTFSLENMSRSIRIGTKYHCRTSVPGSVPGNIGTPQDCNSSGGGKYLAFEGFAGDSGTNADQIVYRIVGTQLERSLEGGADNTFIALTSPEVVVDEFKIYVQGAPRGDSRQPSVIIVLRGTAGASLRSTTKFNIQTSATQRIPDF